MDLGVIILAGGLPARGLWEICQKRMIDIVLNAVLGIDPTEIVLVGDRSWINEFQNPSITKLECAGSMIENLKAGLRTLTTKQVLIITCDLPFVTDIAIRKFVAEASSLSADLVYSICTKDDCQALAPGMKRTCVGLRDGIFTGGNAFYIRDRETLNDKFDLVESAYAMRKEPKKLAGMLGGWVIANIIISKLIGTCFLSVEDLEATATKAFGLSLRACVSEPSLGSDVDTDEQLEAARK
jgi:GTP:adenosylcobinamide-phosphate guanylyltransferase